MIRLSSEAEGFDPSVATGSCGDGAAAGIDDIDDGGARYEACLRHDPLSDDHMQEYVMAFESTHVAMTAARALETHGARMIPTPRAISASCGMSQLFKAPCDDDAVALAASVSDAHGLATLYAKLGEEYRLVERL